MIASKLVVVRNSAEAARRPRTEGTAYWWPSLGTAGLRGAPYEHVVVTAALAAERGVCDALRELFGRRVTVERA